MNGAQLRADREARGLTLRGVAHLIGMDPSYLSRVERGKANLTIEKLADLLEVIGPANHADIVALYADRR